MGQAERGIPEIAAVEPAESIGRYLARQRRLRGIEIEELSRATRIPVRSLLRLESGAFDAEPDGFVRGFVRTVADALGLPADETIARMLPEVSGEAELRSRRLGSRALRAVLALAALAAVGFVLWIAGTHGGASAAHFPSRNALVVRRDAVRALAAERGILGPDPSEAIGSPGVRPQGAEGAAQRAGSVASESIRSAGASASARKAGARSERSQQTRDSSATSLPSPQPTP
jgi:hypothetical protein